MAHMKEFEHLKIKLEDIKKATNNFSNDNIIGEGGFGQVYTGEIAHSKGQTVAAFKRLNRTFGQGDPEFWKEIMTLSFYRHENIVSLLGYCDDSHENILVYEYASRKSLDQYLHHDDLTWVQRLKICIGAARGLAHLHNPQDTQLRLLHRDIKSSNILLDENWNAKISDFGLSKFGPANKLFTYLISHAVGTLGYCDPLYMESGLLTKESDVYSFGVVLFEVLCGRLCIRHKNDTQPLITLVREYKKNNKTSELIYGKIENAINPNALKVFVKIAYQCLERERKERPSMTQIVKALENALKIQISEEPPPYAPPVHQRFESFENPLTRQGSSSFDSHEEQQSSSGNGPSGSALYDFIANGDDELNLTAGEEFEIEYEVEGWFYVKKKRPGRDGKMAGLVPVTYVSQS